MLCRQKLISFSRQGRHKDKLIILFTIILTYVRLTECFFSLEFLNTFLLRDASESLDGLLLQNYHNFKIEKASASFLSYILGYLLETWIFLSTNEILI